jgi:predicted flap endonuclease-1-like 5' DNA nuclease
MLDILNPCNNPDAWWQQLIMLAGPLLLGLLWAKGKNTPVDDGNAEILASLDAELADCQKNNSSIQSKINTIAATPEVAPIINTLHTEEAIEAKPIISTKKDDLKVVEGIGPKIEGLFNDAGILSFEQLANTPAAKLKEILVAAGSRYQMHDPTTWPAQSKLAADGKWEELKKWQDELNKGTA